MQGVDSGKEDLSEFAKVRRRVGGALWETEVLRAAVALGWRLKGYESRLLDARSGKASESEQGLTRAPYPLAIKRKSR